MRRFFTASFALSALFTITALTAETASATGNGCPSCVAKLDITQTSPGLGDISRDADSDYASWGSGSVKLACDDGSSYDTVSLALEPYDLESGIDLYDVSLPNVDLTASGLDCQIDVDDGLQSAVIDVDIL